MIILKFLLLINGVIGLGLSTQDKHIKPVIIALTDLKKSVISELKEAKKNYECQLDWCKKEVSMKKQEIDEAETRHDDAKALVEDNKAKKELYSVEVGKLDKEIAKLNDALATMENIRSEENEKYEQEKSNNYMSMGQLKNAMDVLQKFHSAASGDSATESNMALGVFKSLLNNLKNNQAKSDEAEEKAMNRYNALYKSKKAQLKDSQDMSTRKKILMKEAASKVVEGEKDIKASLKIISESKKSLAKTEESCTQQKSEFKVLATDKEKEIKGLGKAVNLLKTVKLPKKQTALAFLQLTKTSNKNMSEELQKGNFDKVTGMIGGLVDTLKKQKEEAKAKAKQCKLEKEKNENNLVEKKDIHEQLKTLLKKRGDMVSTLTTQLDEANAGVKKLQESDNELTRLRKKAKTAYEKNAKDRKIALKVLVQARSILQKAFAKSYLDTTGDEDNLSFVQMLKKSKSKMLLKKMDTKKSGTSLNPAVELVGQIIDDLRREGKDSDNTEQQQVKEYASQMIEMRKELDLKMETIRELSERKGKSEIQRDVSEEDKQASIDALKAASEKLKALKNECSAFLNDFKDEQSKLKFQMEQLNDAHAILSGASLMQMDKATAKSVNEQVSLPNQLSQLDEIAHALS